MLLQSLKNASASPQFLSKKRKLDQDGEKVNGTANKPSKEDQREAKRLKKLQEIDANGPKAEQPDRYKVVDGDEGSKAAKKARKEEKRRMKAERQAAVQDSAKSLEKSTNGITNGAGISNGTESKSQEQNAEEAKRADKARRKAEKRAQAHGDSNQNGETPDGSSKSAQKVEKSVEGHQAQTAYTEDPTLTALPQATIDGFLNTNHITLKDPSSGERPSCRPIIDFQYLPFSAKISTSGNSPFASFKSPTPIQAAAWPHLLAGRDVIGVAETGSGKTLAFGVPCIRALSAFEASSKRAPVRAVMVSPTRELAVQIHTQLETLAAPTSLKTACVYGGVPKDTQREALKKANIIVATPGRLNDFIEEGAADLSHVQYLVLDEADRMLDKGFEDAIRTIISKTPSTTSGRQTCMFTATWPPSVRELAATFMTKPVHIAIGANNPTGELRANRAILQIVEVIDPSFKEGRLRELIKQHSENTYINKNTKSSKLFKHSKPTTLNRILVFCLYKKEAARVENMLRKTLGSYVKVAGIHGDMSQPLRSASLNAFKSGSVTVLVATDVAARGLDIPDVKVVINVTFPLTVEDYVHRIGRTGRAGSEGLAVTMFTEYDKGLAGGLINVLRAAEQEIPEDLLKFGTTVKKKTHEAYGNFYREPKEGEKTKGTMVRFD